MLELVTSAQQQQFGLAKRDTLPKYCRDCRVRFACHGECPKNRLLTPDGEPGLNYLCAGYMAFFIHIDRAMRLMAGLFARDVTRTRPWRCSRELLPGDPWHERQRLDFPNRPSDSL